MSSFLKRRKSEKYLKGVEEQLTVHADLPARPLKRVRHPDKDDVVDTEHQHQHEGGLRQFPTDTNTQTCTQSRAQFG